MRVWPGNDESVGYFFLLPHTAPTCELIRLPAFSERSDLGVPAAPSGADAACMVMTNVCLWLAFAQNG